MSVVSVVCCKVEVSATDSLLVQRSPTECDVSECDRVARILRKFWPTGRYRTARKNVTQNKFTQVCRRNYYESSVWISS
jgi:hypothetical protein